MAVPFKAGSFDVSAVLADGLGGLRSSNSIQYSAVLRKYCAFFDLDYDCQDRSYFSDSRVAHYLYAIGEEFQYHPSAGKTHGAAINYASCHFGNSNFRLFPHEWLLTKEIVSVSYYFLTIFIQHVY